MGERVRRGQLDGVASGHFLCQAVAPSMRVLRIPGVFESRDEARDVVTRLQSTIEDEAAKNGFVILGAAGLGPDIFFTREPVRSLEDLRRLKLWRWDLDDVGISTSREMGMTVVPMRPGRRAPRLRRQADRRLHRGAVGGAGVPVVVGGELRDRPARGLPLRLPGLRRAPVPAAAARAAGGAARGRGAHARRHRRARPPARRAAPQRAVRQAGPQERARVAGVPRGVLRGGEARRAVTSPIGWCRSRCWSGCCACWRTTASSIRGAERAPRWGGLPGALPFTSAES